MRNIIISFLFLCPILAWAGDKTKVGFYKGNLMSIQETAKAEGKLYFYDFVASWCTPCKWMDETTYTDANLANYIDANYVAAKVDIDDFDGYALKEKYKIQVLPTIIVFNQDGKVVGRYEESLSSTKMTEILKKHNSAANGAGRAKTKTLAAAPSATISRPALGATITKIVNSVKSSDKMQEATKPTMPAKEVRAMYSPGTGLYKIDISRRPNSGFSIQTISLGQYDNVVKTYEELKKTHEKQPVLLFIETISGKTTYKIMVGEFKTKEEAEKYKKTKLSDGFIKDLSKLK
jgi:thiol-disulfide isomerase/thioredoxin